MIRNVLRSGLAAAVVACGGGAPGVPAPRGIDPALEDSATVGTAVQQPVQIIFDWSLQDRDARFSGQGVARVKPPALARVDLFGPRGEGYLSAVLDDFELRLPGGAENVPLPPPALFWTVLGVFRAPPGAELVGAERRDNAILLAYAANGDVWRFRLEDGKLRHAEWTGRGQGRRTVELPAAESNGVPQAVTYRDWPAFLELRLTPREVIPVAGFPDEIWTLRH